MEKELRDAQELIAADRNKIAIQLATLKSLEKDIKALKLAKKGLENKVNVLAVTLENSQSSLAKSQDKLKTSLNSLTASRDRSKKLLAKYKKAVSGFNSTLKKQEDEKLYNEIQNNEIQNFLIEIKDLNLTPIEIKP